MQVQQNHQINVLLHIAPVEFNPAIHHNDKQFIVCLLEGAPRARFLLFKRRRLEIFLQKFASVSTRRYKPVMLVKSS